MKKRTKTKRQKAKVSTAKKTTKVQSYESHYLAIVLVTFLLMEGFLFTSTTANDWQQGLAVLDVSTAVTQTISDAQAVFTPVADVVAGVNEFYQLAATEMMAILDLGNTGTFEEVTQVASGVNEFYQQASIELASMLDFSEVSSWPAQVAGISVSAY